MKLKDSTAAKCRWFEYLPKFIEDYDIVWDKSENSYSGRVLVVCMDNYYPYNYLFIDYDYGSCSGCDEWESDTVMEACKKILDCCLWLTQEEYTEWDKRYREANEYYF